MVTGISPQLAEYDEFVQIATGPCVHCGAAASWRPGGIAYEIQAGSRVAHVTIPECHGCRLTRSFDVVMPEKPMRSQKK